MSDQKETLHLPLWFTGKRTGRIDFPPDLSGDDMPMFEAAVEMVRLIAAKNPASRPSDASASLCPEGDRGGWRVSDPTVQLSIHDGSIEAAYIRFAEGKSEETVEIIEDTVLADYDADGNLLSIELLTQVALKVRVAAGGTDAPRP